MKHLQKFNEQMDTTTHFFAWEDPETPEVTIIFGHEEEILAG